VPAIVVPAIVAVTHKSQEARRVRACHDACAADRSMPFASAATATFTGK
jgi:hypothetical protein